jgi:Holliday junction resolvase RusA-like endonuclease
MGDVVRITVDGAPIGKGRPRFVRSLGIAFTPKKTADYEAVLQAAGAQAMAGRPPLDGPLVVRLTAFMPIAVSWSKKKTAAAIEGSVRPGKPDLDNILKTLDALNQIVWRDDSQIAEARLSKLYDADPRLEIEVERLHAESSTEHHALIPENSALPVQGALL